MKVDLRKEQIEMLLDLLSQMKIGGTVAHMREMVLKVDSITVKLQSALDKQPKQKEKKGR